MESRQPEGTVVGAVSLEHTISGAALKDAEAGKLTRVKHWYFMNLYLKFIELLAELAATRICSL